MFIVMEKAFDGYSIYRDNLVNVSIHLFQNKPQQANKREAKSIQSHSCRAVRVRRCRG